LGEHTREVLTELGYDDNDVARLVERGAVAVAQRIPADAAAAAVSG